MQTAVHPKDEADDTRSRLIEAASAIFAERGYQSATTREICVQARANAAAVNYHFGDKLGLYKATLEFLISQRDWSVEKDALSAMTPQLALRAFIQAMFDNVSGCDSVDLYTRLMAHELSEPTPGLALVVNKIIAPRTKILTEIIARFTDDSPGSLSVRLATHSIIGQVVHYMHARPVIKLLWPKWQITPAARRKIIDHVTTFSLAGLEQMARTKAARKGKR